MTAVGVGAPPVLLDESEAVADNGDDDDDEGGGGGDEATGGSGDGGGGGGGGGGGSSTDSSTAAVPAPRYLLVINDCDVVPRLLGSPMPVETLAMLGAMPQGGGTIAPAVMRRKAELMRTMQRFTHPPRTDGLLLRDGEAKLVPPSERASVLHLHEALSPSLLDHHGLRGDKESYIGGLEIAAAIAELDEA